MASGADQSASFPQAAGNVVQNLAGLSLGGLSFGGGETFLAGSALTLDRSSGTPELSVAGGATATFDLALSGTDGLAKTGAGTLVLQGGAGPGGASTVAGGMLALRNGYSAPSFDIAGGAVLQLDHATDLNLASASFTGAGTLRKTGPGQAVWGSSIATFALAPGALIDIQGGSFVAGSFANENWSNNRSDLHVAAGAVFKTVEANVRLDRITGEGTLGTGFAGAGYQNLTVGIEGGSSRFDGVIANTDDNPSFVGNLVKQGGGTLTLTNTSTYRGSTTIAAGTLQLGDGTAGKDGRLANTSGVTNNGVLAFHLYGSQGVGQGIGGSGSVRKSGPGELSFTANHAYAGGTTVEQGALVLDGAASGVGRIRGAATVRAGGELRVSGGDGTGLGYLGGAKLDSLHLDGGLLNSPGVCHLWQASLLLTGGELRGNNGVNDPAGAYFEWGNTPVTSLASPDPALISGRIRIRPDANPTLTLTVADGPAATDLRLAAAVTEAAPGAGIQKSGPGTLELAGSNRYSGVTVLGGGVVDATEFSDYGQPGSLGNRASDSGANVGLLFRGGTLRYRGSTAQATNRAIRVSTQGGATLDASGSDPTATLRFTAASSPDFFENPGDRSLTFTGSNPGPNLFAMAIGEAGGSTRVTKSGTGTWILGGTNSYSGPTQVDAGKLVLSGSLATSGSVSIAAEATLDLRGPLATSGSLTNAGTLRLVGNASLSFGSFTNTGVLDLIHWNGTLPAGFVNLGVVLDREALRIASSAKSGNDFSLSLHGHPGHDYQLQRADDLAGGWQNIGPARSGTNAPLQFTDVGGAAVTRRFYRVLVTTP